MTTRKWIAIAAIVLLVFLLSAQLLQAANVVSAELGMEKSFLGQSDLPRGIRNNNPGNLKMTNPQQGWTGAIDRSKNTDGVFEQFTAYIFGVRAMVKLLRNKINAGENTIRKIVYRWAPPGENDTEAVAASIADLAGIPQNFPITPTDEDRLFAVAQAIERMENGIQIMTRQDFNRAWSMI